MAGQKGLGQGPGGQGLGALFGDVSLGEAGDFTYLPIAKIEPRRDQPRVHFEREPLEELAESIREHGVLQPLTVREVGGAYQIIAGERRWRAARLAGLDELPARVIAADDRAATELALVENLQREDLNPIEEATGYRALIDDYGLTQEEVARRMGKSRPAVANALRLLTLPETLTASVRSGELSPGGARALLGVKDAETLLGAARDIIARGLNVREVERLVKRLNAAPRERTEPERGGVDYVAEMEGELTRALGRRVKIVNGRNKGRIELEYYGNEDFMELLDRLSKLAEGAL